VCCCFLCVGAVGVVAVLRLTKVLWPKEWPPGHDINLLFLGVGILVITGPLAWLALGGLEQSYSFDTFRFAYWVATGRGNSLLAGVLAGYVLATAIVVIERWMPGANTIRTLLVLAAGPAIMILLLLCSASPVYGKGWD
jgi:hypothetical protein